MHPEQIKQIMESISLRVLAGLPTGRHKERCNSVFQIGKIRSVSPTNISLFIFLFLLWRRV